MRKKLKELIKADNRLSKLEKKIKKYENISEPITWIYIGLFWGFLFNLFANIIHDSLKNFIFYNLIVTILTLITSYLFIKSYFNTYLKPYKDLVSEYKKDLKKLQKKLNYKVTVIKKESKINRKKY